MSITTDFDTLWLEKKQRDVTVEAKAQLQNCMNVVNESKARLQEIVDSGAFNTIPNSVKLSLNKAFTVVKTASVSFEESDIQEVLNWSGR